MLIVNIVHTHLYLSKDNIIKYYLIMIISG